MRIALFTDTYLPQINGVSLTLGRLFRHFEGRGVEYLAFVPRCAGEVPDTDRVRRIPSVPFPLYPGHRVTLPVPRTIRGSLRGFRPDLIHLATPFSLGLTGRRLARKYGIPVVASYHTHFDRYLSYYRLSFLSPWIWSYMGWFHDPCESVYAPSAETACRLEERGFPRVGLWQRGVDTDRFHPARGDAFRDRHGIREPHILLYAGRLAPEKDLDILLGVMDRLTVPLQGKVRWVVAGDGPMRHLLQNRCRADVTFTGMLNEGALAEAYAAADLLVFPSTTETFGNVVLEAHAAGTPVVAARAGGVREIVRHGETGLLCGPRSVDETAAAVCRLLQDEPLRLRMGLAARRHALERSWDTVFDRLLEQYAEAAGQPSPIWKPIGQEECDIR